ncbi:hypothetical protein NUW54_g10607 [Trametes sanguinea]|uniref:Uncharacterized protein n=1 Tax=Trametes sanguinea TaxID=158606 RepID=A0ACC1NWI2_9APHY|nr:hypothetical protein NUW54_g10607 [Trametes sanguinea]
MPSQSLEPEDNKNQEAAHIAKQADWLGLRTVGVLTVPAESATVAFSDLLSSQVESKFKDKDKGLVVVNEHAIFTEIQRIGSALAVRVVPRPAQ